MSLGLALPAEPAAGLHQGHFLETLGPVAPTGLPKDRLELVAGCQAGYCAGPHQAPWPLQCSAGSCLHVCLKAEPCRGRDTASSFLLVGWYMPPPFSPKLFA